ncbi:hypothetical protein [Staphylococcus cohnii]|uniref:hypothetical protein n=1 Tax=Staphylococcus cohnii TaxID=29382 RepID=UPI003AC8937E
MGIEQKHLEELNNGYGSVNVTTKDGILAVVNFRNEYYEIYKKDGHGVLVLTAKDEKELAEVIAHLDKQ